MVNRKNDAHLVYFQDIPESKQVHIDSTYQGYKKFIQEVLTEKQVLENILQKKVEKSREYKEAQEKEHKIGVEYRELIDKENKQRNKLISMIPSRF